jgi:hypothetical protein
MVYTTEDWGKTTPSTTDVNSYIQERRPVLTLLLPCADLLYKTSFLKCPFRLEHTLSESCSKTDHSVSVWYMLKS